MRQAHHFDPKMGQKKSQQASKLELTNHKTRGWRRRDTNRNTSQEQYGISLKSIGQFLKLSPNKMQVDRWQKLQPAVADDDELNCGFSQKSLGESNSTRAAGGQRFGFNKRGENDKEQNSRHLIISSSSSSSLSQQEFECQDSKANSAAQGCCSMMTQLKLQTQPEPQVKLSNSCNSPATSCCQRSTSTPNTVLSIKLDRKVSSQHLYEANFFHLPRFLLLSFALTLLLLATSMGSLLLEGKLHHF